MSGRPGLSLLRFITCGSVDDGKSTLIGRLLYDSKLLLEDQISALEEASRAAGTRGQQLDFALLMDGLAAEREQNITIDVAYRYFATPRRRFIVADTPGHEQYTRNMVTGASTADLAVILVDARKGLLTQTRRHSHLVSLLGIRHVVLAVNKMDLVDCSQQRFESLEREYREFAERAHFQSISAIPMVAVDGDNLTMGSARMGWYRGPTLLDLLETVTIDSPAAALPFRMPVQWVNRPHLDFRGYSGRIAAGSARPGDRVIALPSGRECRIARIVTAGGELPVAGVGQSVTLTLTEQIDLSRGDLLAAAAAPAPVAAQFEAMLVALNANAVLPGRSYKMKIGSVTVAATVAPLKYRIDVDTWQHSAAERLELNEVGVGELELDRPIAFEPYQRSRDLGGFILIDRITHEIVAAGTLNFALRRSNNVHWQTHDIDKHARAALNGQRPTVIWMTGFSGAGKSSIANLVEKRLHALGRRTYLLDGDNIRHGLNKDLGFTEQDRVENIRRVAEVARLMVDAGLIVLVAFISPFRAERQAARALFANDEFVEVFVDAPLADVERRDVKGLYKRARAGQLKNFTGIDSAYEPPENPELHLDMSRLSPLDAAAELAEYLLRQRS
ncbi:MAG TPA: sulfate adenylyltransferase subunit CysN [Steroidobacteraceae bacterium]|jgi:bifunctional enzyme CysN/CysC